MATSMASWTCTGTSSVSRLLKHTTRSLADLNPNITRFCLPLGRFPHQLSLRSEISKPNCGRSETGMHGGITMKGLGPIPLLLQSPGGHDVSGRGALVSLSYKAERPVTKGAITCTQHALHMHIAIGYHFCPDDRICEQHCIAYCSYCLVVLDLHGF
eukprot:Gb_41100 [translate_table: standard]